MLTLRDRVSRSDGTDAELAGIPIVYEVLGLPKGQEALIWTDNYTWQIQRIKDGVVGESAGTYASKEEALAALGDSL
jgi:hypothetical protein